MVYGLDGHIVLIEGPDGGGKTLGARFVMEMFLGSESASSLIDYRHRVKKTGMILQEVEWYPAYMSFMSQGEARVVEIGEEDGLRLRLPIGLEGLITAEPTGITPYGAQLRMSLAGKGPEGDMLNLFAYDRFFHLNTFVAPLLRAGLLVGIDRSLPSTLAYQSYDLMKNNLSLEGAIAQTAGRMRTQPEKEYNGNLLLQAYAQEGRVLGVFVFTAQADTLTARLTHRGSVTVFDEHVALQEHVRRIYAGRGTALFLRELETFLPGVPYIVIDTTGLDMENGGLDRDLLRERVGRAYDVLHALAEKGMEERLLILPDELTESVYAPDTWDVVSYRI